MKRLLTIAAIATLVGCASKGQNFDMADVDGFTPGVTTYAQVVEKLGKPKSQGFEKDGGKSVTWVYARASIVGSESKGTRMIFDKSDKLVRVASKVE